VDRAAGRVAVVDVATGAVELIAALFTLDSTDALWSADRAAGQARQLTASADTATAPSPEVVRFASEDGVRVSALVYRPAGPGVLATNIRGSSGYGLRYQPMIYRDWGGGDVTDLRAAAEFLRAQPWADPDRLGVYGASCGGFASLCCMTRLPEYWRAGVSECGGPDLVEKARTLPPTWRRRAADRIGSATSPTPRIVSGSGRPARPPTGGSTAPAIKSPSSRSASRP
jgi:dipeptidyl aminopeptidase/acylaminoacyl peptidase